MRDLRKAEKGGEFRAGSPRLRHALAPLLGKAVTWLGTAGALLLVTAWAVLGSFSAEEEGKGSADLVRRGDEAFTAGRYSAAVEFYRSALERDERNSTVRLKLIGLLARLAGREDDAKREIETAIRMENLTAEEISSIADICYANGFPEEARSALELLLKRKPGDLSALAKLIEVLLSQKDFQRAGKEIEAYRDSSASTVEGLEMIAAKCAERLQYELAAIAYQGVLSHDQTNLRALIGISECLVKSGQLAEAVEKLSQAVECHPGRAQPAVALGELFFRKGEYASSEEAFGNALKAEPKSVEAADGLSRVLLSTGRYSEARHTLSEALKARPDSPVLFVAMGRVLSYVGEYESARKQFDRALSATAGYPDAIVGLGLSYRETGKLQLARQQFLKLYDFWDAHLDRLDSVPARDMVDVAIACALTDNPQDAIEVLEQVLKKDPTNTKARLWEARLFAERHQPRDASRELQKLLTINPNHPQAHAELASLYFDSSQFDLAEASCQRALKANPNLIRALDVLCSVRILDFEYDKAEHAAKRALAINPRSLSSLSSLASCYWQRGKKDDYEEVQRKVFDINPVYSEFYLTVARACEKKRRNEEAIALLKRAIALKPDYAPAYTRVGILLMREGEEEAAEKYLRKSFRLDSYNPKTTNFINLLEHMKRDFVSTCTQHFLLKWDREKGSVLGFFLPEYVEEVYREVCEEFAYEPKNPTLVEVFDSHDEFSARIVGLPFIATVGASLGKVVAADSPKKASFDWKDVLRHEFVHVVNLQQSKMQIPFWFTEGLATYHEQSAPPAVWDRLIARMLYVGRIIPLEELNGCFTRPKTPRQKQAAYAESNLICRYLYGKYGREVIREMIEMYGKNFSTEEVIQRYFSMSQSEFERKIREYIFATAREKRVNPLFLRGDGELITAALTEKPEDSLLRIARAKWLLNQALMPRVVNNALLDEAQHILSEVIGCPEATAIACPGTRGEAVDEPKAPRASRPSPTCAARTEDARARGAYSTLAEIHLARKEYEKAKDAALKAMAVDEKDFIAHRCLGLVYQKTDKMKEAARELAKAVKLYPRAADLWYALARLYVEQKDEGAMIRSLEGAAAADPKNMQTSKRLADICLSKKNYDGAVEVLERALRYDLYDAEIYKLMAKAFEGKGEEKTARRYAGFGAEAAYITAKSLIPFQRDRVTELLKLSLELNPEHQKARDLLSRIGK